MVACAQAHVAQAMDCIVVLYPKVGKCNQTIGCPKVRVEIFTLARGARACIESTRFIIMT
jgi:hypothetical protein